MTGRKCPIEWRLVFTAVITGSCLLAATAESVAEGTPTREKKIYAHYMGCYPVAAAATAYHRSADAHQVRHDGKRQHDAYGDRWRNWPLVPDGMKVSLEESADLEIRRALRAGIDGFAIDAWAGGENAKQVFSALIEVAEQKDYPFVVTICLDAGIQSNQGLSDSIGWMLDNHGDSPKLARRDGKPLVFETRYAIMDLNRHFIDWWKTGKQPTSDHDKIYLIYRKYPQGAKFYPFEAKREDSGGVIEVLTILPAPAKLRLVGRNVEWDAPAGMSYKQFPLTPGPVVAELLRDGQVLTRLESPEPITDRPFREQNGMTCFSTEFQHHWKADFGDQVPPLIRGEYADDDHDSLPNWFEMYWFGKFLDYSTATATDANADPDGDGRTNIKEWRAQTDPTKPPTERHGGSTRQRSD